jgi:hypothetical protein
MLRERPEQVRAAIRAMLSAEELIYRDLRAAVRHALKFYPGFGLDELVAATMRQPSRVDIRHLTHAVFARWDSLRSLELVPGDADPPAVAVCLDLLTDELNGQTAKENA